jgi:hypothetical protein
MSSLQRLASAGARFDGGTCEWTSFQGPLSRDRPRRVVAAVALLCFLSGVQVGWLSLVYPPLRDIKAVGTTGLYLGLLLIAAAMSLDLIESILASNGIEEEVADLDDEAKR